jgi:aspartate-semialdehyde dehydrogenase
VAVLGATGAVGQRMVRLLEDHPWFRVGLVTGSERSAGRSYGEAVSWTQDAPIPPGVAELRVGTNRDALDAGFSIAFSALDASVAGDAERSAAEAGVLVVSNARNHRMDPGVPLLVPEVNPDHLALLDTLPHRGGRGAPSGGIITNPNCSTIGIVMALAPLHRAVGVEGVHLTTLQAISGAGMPGIPALAIHDNVIPRIEGEEEKLEREPAKILGAPGRPAGLRISAHCTRVPVTDGHTATLSVKLGRPLDPAAAAELLRGFRGRPQELGLPSAPAVPILVHEEADAPQPRRHAGLGGGMTVSVGRIRPCPLLDLRMVVLSHNTVRGAAGGAILCAELALAEGRVSGASAPLLVPVPVPLPAAGARAP